MQANESTTVEAWPRLGLGAGSLGGPEVSDADAEALLHRAYELGIRVFDAARSYGEAEARLGRYLSGFEGVRFSTKVGYGVEGVPDWTGRCVELGVDRAREVMRLDRIDVVFLHSCPVEILAAGEVVEALEAAKEAGKIRKLGYSGDGGPLAWAVESGRFDVVQASFSLLDRANGPALRTARENDRVVFAKRSLGNAPWRGPGSAAAGGAAAYDQRWQLLADTVEEAGPVDEVALRYCAFHGPVDLALVGTRNPTRLERAADVLGKGPLEPDWVTRFESLWDACGQDWAAII